MSDHLSPADRAELARGKTPEAELAAAGGWCAPSQTIYDLAVGSREQQLWRGEVEPTPEEIRKAAGELHDQYLADLGAWEETEAFLAQVESTTFTGLARDLLELHRRHEPGHWCSECEYDEHPVQWPCATARLVLNEDFDVPDRLVYDQPASLWQDENNPRWPFPSGPVDTRLTIPEISVSRRGAHFDGGSPPW